MAWVVSERRRKRFISKSTRSRWINITTIDPVFHLLAAEEYSFRSGTLPKSIYEEGQSQYLSKRFLICMLIHASGMILA